MSQPKNAFEHSESTDCLSVPRKGERWDSVLQQQTCRVMCDPIEGYVMARFKGAMPFIVHVSDWNRKFTRKP